MQLTKLGLGLAALAGGGATLAAAAGARALLRRPLPRRRAAGTVPGLGAAVEVVRDAWGVPHIRAASVEDAYAAQGYVLAQDRLFQLEINRRLGAGRLAELFGPVALPTDRFLRRLGLRRAAEAELTAMSPAARALLEAYCAGLNAAISALHALPLELQLLGHRPLPWTAADCLGYAKVMSWSLGFNMEHELLRARLVDRLGPDLAARLEPSYPTDQPLTVPPGATAAAIDLLDQLRQLAPFASLLAPGASNAWALGPARTATGAPIVAADPHLALVFPATWYEVHLTYPGVDVAGAGLVGLPGVVIGHNGHVGWGLTAAPVDVQDLYLERFGPDEPTHYEVDGRWLPAQLVGEVISVKGQREPVIEEVRVTRHGPILTGLRGTTAALALRWTSHDADHFVETITAVNAVRDASALREALRGLGGPTINVVYADAAGSIGYQLAGTVPTRPAGGGLVPLPGWTSEYEWGPPIPYDELPHLLNPPGGVIVSANNRLVDDANSYYLGHEWFNGYRAQRILDLLAGRERHTLADQARIQADVLSLPGLRLQRRCAQLDPTLLGARARPALDLLLAWDGEVRPESAGAAVYGRLLPTLLEQLFRPLLGDLTDDYLGLTERELGPTNSRLGRAVPLALDLLDDPDLRGLPIPTATSAGLSRADSLLAAALDQTAHDLRQILGTNIASWRWGRLHRLVWRHPLGQIKALAPLLNRGPFEMPGDMDTVNYGAAMPSPPNGLATHAWVPAYRLIVDLADPTRSISNLAGGQSGHPFSPHYADQLGAWRSGRHHTLMYDPEAIDKAALGRLVLTPTAEER